MFKKFRFFKRFKKLIFGCFAILFGVVTCCLLGSWTYNSSTQVYTSDNLFNVENFTNGDVNQEYTIDAYQITYNGVIISDRGSLPYNRLTNIIELNSGTYTFKADVTQVTRILIKELNGATLIDNEQYTGWAINFTASSTTSFVFYIYSYTTISCTWSNIMLNSGSTALAWEPYGQYISNDTYEDLFYRYTDLQLDYHILETRYNNVMNHLENYQSVYQDSDLDYLSRNLLNLNDYYYKDNVNLDDYYLYLESSNNTTSDFKLSLGDLSTVNSWLKSGITASGYVITTFTKDDNNYLINFILSGTNSNSEIAYNLSSLPNGKYTLKFMLDYTINKYTLSSIMLNSGEISLPYFPYGDVYDQFEYNNLYQDYLDNLDASFDVGQYTLSVAKQGSYQNQWNFTDETPLTNTDYIDSLGYLDVSSIYNTYIDGNINAILVHLEKPVNVYNYDLMFNNFNLGDNINLLIKLNNNGTDLTKLYSLVSTNVNANETYTLSNFIKYQDASIGILTNYTYQDFAIVWTNTGNSLSNVKLNGQGDYNLGFVNGLAQNNKDFKQLQSNYDTLNSTYNTLQSNFDNLQSQYNDLVNTDLGFSMSKLMWNIASTPFESFKSIWSVNFLDFNIASFITGILSIFVIVWLLKKIF